MEDADGFVRVRPRRNRRLKNVKTLSASAATRRSACYESKEVSNIIQKHVNAFETTYSDFFSGICRPIISLSLSKPVATIAIGLGSLHEFSNENSRIQLALLLKLSAILPSTRIWAYDPTFTPSDIYLLAQYNIDGFSDYFSSKSKLPSEPTNHVFTFMPHCVKQVHSEVLLFQARHALKTVVFFGNRIDLNNMKSANHVLYKESVVKLNEADRKVVSKLFRAFNDTYLSIVHFLS